MSIVVIFAIGQEDAADAYLSFVNAQAPDPPFDSIRFDKWGQRVVGYLGPGGYVWNSEPYPEPEGGVAARSVGVLQDGYDQPEEEEEA